MSDLVTELREDCDEGCGCPSCLAAGEIERLQKLTKQMIEVVQWDMGYIEELRARIQQLENGLREIVHLEWRDDLGILELEPKEANEPIEIARRTLDNKEC